MSTIRPGDRSSIRLLEARLGMRFGGVDVSVFGRNLLNDAPDPRA